MKKKHLLLSLTMLLAAFAIVLLATSAIQKPSGQSDPNNQYESINDTWDYLEMVRANQITGTVNPMDVLQAEQMITKSGGFGKNIVWQNAGPDNFGGRVRAVLYDLKDNTRKTIIASGTNSGLWKSTTEGLIWEMIPGTDAIIHVTSMVQANDGVIYVGTGEAFEVHRFAARSGYPGSGIFKSTNGTTFSLLPATSPTTNDTTSAFAYINKLAVDPANSSKVYAATFTGLYYSTDGGTTWQLAKTSNQVNLTGVASDVKTGANGFVIASVAGKTYIAATGNATSFEQTILDPLPANANAMGRIELAIAPSDPNFLYALVSRSSPAADVGKLLNIYQSRDKGATWRIIGPGGSPLFNVFGSDNVGNYAATIVVNPGDKTSVLVGGKNIWLGRQVLEEGFFDWSSYDAGSASGFSNSNHHTYIYKPGDNSVLLIGTDRGLYRATASGLQSLNRNLQTNQCYTVAISGGKQLLLGTQANSVLMITGKGNTDKQATKIHTSFNGAYVAQSLINHKAVIYSAPNPATGNIPIFRSNDNAETVSPTPFIPMTTPTSTTPIFTNTGVFLTPFIHWESFDFQQSKDSTLLIAKDNTFVAGAVKWVRSAQNKYPFRYTLPHNMNVGEAIKVKDIIASRFFIAVKGAVYMTKTVLNFVNSPTWFKIANLTTTPPTTVTPTCIAVSKDGNTLWVGNRNGQVYRITNLHNAYDLATADVGQPTCVVQTTLVTTFTNRIVTSIAVDPGNPEHIIVTLGNYGNEHYVYRSTNALSANVEFSSVQGNLPRMPVYSSLLVHNEPGVVLLGTEKGLWINQNIFSGNNWVQESEGIGNIPVMMIVQQLINQPTVSVQVDANTTDVYPGVTNYGKIWIATYGRGIYSTDRFIGTGPTPVINNSAHNTLQIFPNPATESAYTTIDAQQPGRAVISYYNLNGMLVNQAQQSITATGMQTIQLPVTELSPGVYMIRIQLNSQLFIGKLIVR